VKPARKKIIVILFAVYLSFILLSSVFYLAERVNTRGVLKDGEYTSHLVFPEDGTYGHYKTVILFDKNQEGLIDLIYYLDSNTLYINKLENIKELTIDCREMYQNKYEEVFGTDPSQLEFDYYKTFFEETNGGLFTVVVNSDSPMDKLKFLNTPLPTSVLVNNQEWWQTETSYYSVKGDDVTITNIPDGTTTVKIFFKGITGQTPTASFSSSKGTALRNEDIYFDATESRDLDGEILHYIWDFGDGSQGSGKIDKHSYRTEGRYEVTLTVRDNDYLEDTISRIIFIVETGVDSDNDGVADEFDPHPDSNIDTDADGLSDDFEDVVSETKKNDRDSDNDGWTDEEEWSGDTDPNNPRDYPSEKGDEVFSDFERIIILIIVIAISFALVIFTIYTKNRGGGRREIRSRTERSYEDEEDDYYDEDDDYDYFEEVEIVEDMGPRD
jgi:hypothetical protein